MPEIQNEIANDNKDFDLSSVCNYFLSSIENQNQIKLLDYLEGYRELIKFFDVFGTLFGFVTQDVYSKIEILKNYTLDETVRSNYESVRLMMDFERNENLLTDRERPSGSRTLLRLHRALEFISKFLHEIIEISDEQSTATITRNAYRITLARYHPWYIRNMVQLAIFALPCRRTIIERIFGQAKLESLRNDSIKINENLKELADITDQVFHYTQRLYEEYNLLDLP
ncbi:Ceramide-1-phosphate transfer protein [Sarcoptes scabiei]|uniref:Ceramide-1-phosphate transfer protein n=1 Tax=Sarcoptes scabiei TaxID=52283 RepID=A0A132AC00_SARSC|nr:Ceramide-1-phosphate transfer protein [Sarcoptes scabiei]KPM08399.1 glycolipid transfer protein domain-containing protein 1-like protein [Sarcoptes scabiei]